MRDSVPSMSYSSVCNVLSQWSISLIPTYRVYRLYDTYHSTIINNIIHIIVPYLIIIYHTYHSTIIISYRYMQILSLGSCQAGSSGAKLTRGVTCNVHPGRPCQPCILCKQGNLSIYFHPKTWKNRASIDQLRELEPALDIQAGEP